jgi:hypothetical protein
VEEPQVGFQEEAGAVSAPESPPYYAPTPPDPTPFPSTRRDSRANTAYVLGIASLALAALSCVPFVSVFACVEPIVGVIAIILGSMVKRDIDTRGGSAQDRRRAHQGMVMGIVGTAIFFVLMLVTVIMGVGLGFLGEM